MKPPVAKAAEYSGRWSIGRQRGEIRRARPLLEAEGGCHGTSGFVCVVFGVACNEHRVQ